MHPGVPWSDPPPHQYRHSLPKRDISSRRRAIVTELRASLDQVPFDHEAARQSARIRIDLESRGLLIGPVDLLIAGTAVSRRAVLVTNNTREFSRVKGLNLTDWTS